MRIDPGTRALVSGASRGIGRALCAELAARGATVGLVARSGDELEALAASLPGTHHPLPCDVGDAAAIQAAVARFIERAGGLELVVANAGVAHYGPFVDLPLDAMQRMTRSTGSARCTPSARPSAPARSRGRATSVIVSSGAGLRSFPFAAVYGATKAAQRGFGRGAAP
jgi:short-subunit dehydrogenase